jgi:hypothetical protein
LLQQLKAHPRLAAALTDIDNTQLNKYPQFLIEPTLVEPEPQAAFFAALDTAIAPSPASP